MKGILAIVSLLFLSHISIAGDGGFVTPTELDITLTSASLTPVTTDGYNPQSFSIFSGQSIVAPFKRTDSDLVEGKLEDNYSFPSGRWSGISICFKSDRSIILNGNKYEGENGSAFHNGDLLYSVGSNALTANSISNVATSNPTTLTGFTVPNPTSSEFCSSTNFPSTVCLQAPGEKCEASDVVVTNPKLILLLDLYHAIPISADNASADNHIALNLIPLLSDPGAAIHLAGTTPTGVFGVSVIFDSSKKPLWVNAYASSGSMANQAGVCDGGVPSVPVTSAPSGATVTDGRGWVVKYDDTTGELQFASGGCDANGNNCASLGLFNLVNIKQSVGQTTTISCGADTSGALGFVYKGGPGVPGSSTIMIKKIADPNNIFGICSIPAGCGSYP